MNKFLHKKIVYQPQQGFLLVDILIAALLIGIGFLSIVHIQLSSINDNRNALQRTQASQLVSNYIDRMRSNRGAAKNGNYVYAGGTPSTPACDATAGTGGCTAEQLAEYDIFNWYQILKANIDTGLLPNASAQVTFDGTYYIVELSWDNSIIFNGEDHNGSKTQKIAEPFFPGT